MNFKKMSKQVIAMLIVLVMMFSVAVPAISAAGYIDHLHKDEAGDNTLHYVSLGASNTNGYGHDGYLPEDIYEDPLWASKAELNDYGYDREPANSYPALIRDALALKTGREVDLHQLAISSMRVEEVLWLLDDTFQPDAYMNWRFTGGKSWFDMAKKVYDTTKYSSSREALRGEYRDYISNADVITVDLGWNNFGVYAFNNIKTILSDGNFYLAPAFDRVVEAGQEEEYYAIRDKVFERLSEVEGLDVLSDSLVKERLGMIADVLAYASFGACYNFDKVIGKIYELNPDATVAVINVQNLADGLVVEFEGVELPLGDLYAELIELVELYRTNKSPYANRFTYAYAGDDGDVATFLDDLLAWEGDPTMLSKDMRDCFDMYDDNLYIRSIVEYVMVGQLLSGVFDGFKDVFLNFDPTGNYTYSFAFPPVDLGSVNLAKLDLQHPDEPLEIYGAALAPHLKNLRHFYSDVDPNTDGVQMGKDAYNYVFDNMVAYYMSKGHDATTAAAQVEPYRAQFDQTMLAAYQVYTNTLNYAYDIVATILQYVASIDVLKFDADSLNGFNDKSAVLLGSIAGTFMNNTPVKFAYEMTKYGFAKEGSSNYVPSEEYVPAIEVPQVIIDALKDPASCAIAVLALRYEFGNSFLAHPSVNGNKQIATAVMNALDESDANDFTDKKLNQYIDLFETYLDPYYQEKYAELKANGTIGTLLGGLDTVEGALDALESDLAAFEITADIDLERAEKIRGLALEEIVNLKATIADLRALLSAEELDLGTHTHGQILAALNNLKAHAATLKSLTLEIGYFADPYIADLNAYVEHHIALAADMAEEAYDYLVNAVEEFHEFYLEFVEAAGSFADKIDLELGAAVRAYLLDTPADVINIICAYGKDAALKFVVDAADTANTLYASLSTIVAVLNKHGNGIYNEIVCDPEYVALVNAIELKANELKDLYAQLNESPVLTALELDLIIEKQTKELKALYAQLINVVMKNVRAYDEEVADLLWTALMDTADALGILGENGGAYLAWLDGRTDLMLGALLKSIIENSSEFGGVASAVAWKYITLVEKFLTNASAQIKNQLGLQLALLEEALEALKAQLNGELDAAIAEIEAKIAAIKSMINSGVADVKALVVEIKGLVAAVEALVDGLGDDLDENARELLTVLESLKAIDGVLADMFGEVYDELKGLAKDLALELFDQMLETLKESSPYIDEKLYNYFYNNPEEVVEFFTTYGPVIEKYVDKYGEEVLGVIAYALYENKDEMLAYVLENPEEVFENISYWYCKYGVRVWPMVKVYLDVLGVDYYTVEELEAALVEALDELNALANKLGAEYLEELKALVAEIKAKLDEIEVLPPDVDLDSALAELEALMDELKALVVEMIDGAFTGDYTTNNNSFYVGITGNNSEYANLLAGALGLADKHAVMNWNELDYSVLANADFVTLGYDSAAINGFAANQFLAAVALYGNESLKGQVADYINSVLVGDIDSATVDGMVDGVADMILGSAVLADKTVAEMDWAALVGEDKVALIENVLADVAELLAANGVTGDVVVPVNVAEMIAEFDLDVDFLDFGNNPVFELSIPAADILMLVAESYLYANVSFYKTYAETILNIVELNPDVEIAVLGQYNPFGDMTIAGVTIPLGEVYETVSKVASANALVYALALPNVTYVDISGVNTNWNELASNNAIDFMFSYLSDPTNVLFTNDSHLYVMNQVLAVYGLTCAHDYDGCEDTVCGICGEVREGGHSYTSVVTAPDCVNGGYTTHTCTVCGHSYVDSKVAALGHKYDNACDDECNVCHAKRTVGNHDFGEWDVVVEPTTESEGKAVRTCKICGASESRVIDKLPTHEEELTPTEIVTIVLGSVVVASGIAAGAVLLIKRKRS